VKYLADTYKDEIMGEINISGTEPGKDAIFSANLDGGDDDLGDEDDMYEQARDTVIETGKASTSFLQRKLGVGYSRAARLMDMLEQKGVIGPANGAKPREVYGSGGGSAEAPNSPTQSTEETNS
jgi:S-DNA-T family DNA segregation ATPase FtsK/SpoIIIE